MQKSPLLGLENICVTVQNDEKDLTILDHIFLDFEEGETVAIIGPSGSGKTTLMMICAGLQQPSSGKIIFKGQALPKNENNLTLWRQENIGIVFQNFHLLPASTALENVMLPLELAKSYEPEKQAADLLASVGLSHRMTHRPGQLSGGEQQRVALARAIARRPALLLADEPTGNLDQATGEKVIELLFTQAREYGTTLILVTHDEHIAKRCSRIVSLRDGRLVS